MPVWEDFYRGDFAPYSGVPMVNPSTDWTRQPSWPGGPSVDVQYQPTRKPCGYCGAPLVVDKRERCVNCGGY